MGVMRSLLLYCSENRWLRRHAPRVGLVRRAVTRFMPGEELDDALAAAETLAGEGVSTVLTRLGENVNDRREADAVTSHYLDAMRRSAERGLDGQLSIKLTQLGLDIDRELAFDNLRRLAAGAAGQGQRFYVDMEQHTYTDVTLELYHRLLQEFRQVGVCLQAYLYRTAADLEAIVDAGGAVRLVKGAYQEPPSVAFPLKRDVDANFLALSKTMLGPRARETGFEAVFGTHDTGLIQAIQAHAASVGVGDDGYEFALLYGIQRGEQRRLAARKSRIRVLISYGDGWFPWYMRRLAERPANMWFVAKSLVAR